MRGTAGRAGRRVVAVTGVDGAGKSTLIGQMRESLLADNIPATVVWVRPGMGMARLARLAGMVKRGLGQDDEPAVRNVASAPPGHMPSRRGVVGWVWTMVVTTSFILQVHAGLRRASGVVLCDRYMLDALVTLDVFYAGVDLRAHRALVRHLLPSPAVTIYLDVPLEVAVSRKPGDTVGRDAVGQQLAAYDHRLTGAHDLLRLDGTADSKTLLSATLAYLDSNEVLGPWR